MHSQLHGALMKVRSDDLERALRRPRAPRPVVAREVPPAARRLRLRRLPQAVMLRR